MYDIRTHVSDTILTGWYLTNVQNSVDRFIIKISLVLFFLFEVTLFVSEMIFEEELRI